MRSLRNTVYIIALATPLIACSRTELPTDHSNRHDVSIARQDSLNENIGKSRRNAITNAIARVSPAVVGINVIETREQRVYDPFESFMDDPFFRQFFGGRQGPQTRKYDIKSLGSGFF